jgi:dTDP-4-amino-4,6-dideoxygalactose transaminase
MVGKELEYIAQATGYGQLSGDGKFTALCSQKIVELTRAQNALLTHSCTAALEMAAILCNISPGDEVIMPSFTFVSTANAVALRGATPVFVDIERESFNLDPTLVEAAVTARTKAIFVVHYAGIPADMDPLISIAKKHNLLLVEDAAQALGSSYKGRPCGSLGDLAAFSFHETKNIISGEGGALTVNKMSLLERAEIIREKGTNRSNFMRGEVDKYTWVDIGSSFLPGELISAFLFAQLERIDHINATRLSLFNRYFEGFANLSAQGRVKVPVVPEGSTGNGHMFYLVLRDLEDRTSFITHMKQKGIMTPFHYVPLHSAPGGIQFGRTCGSLDVTNIASSQLVRLPLYVSLGDGIEEVISSALEYLQ